MKKFLNVLLLLAAVSAAVLFVGFLHPADLTLRCQVSYRKPIQDIWNTAVDLEHWAQWNPNVESVGGASERNLHPLWSMKMDGELVSVEAFVDEPFAKFETKVDHGSTKTHWIWEFQNVPAGTLLTITEEKSVPNPFVRGLQAFKDELAPMRTTMIGLGQRHDLKVEPKSVEIGKAIKKH